MIKNIFKNLIAFVVTFAVIISGIQVNAAVSQGSSVVVQNAQAIYNSLFTEDSNPTNYAIICRDSAAYNRTSLEHYKDYDNQVNIMTQISSIGVKLIASVLTGGFSLASFAKDMALDVAKDFAKSLAGMSQKDFCLSLWRQGTDDLEKAADDLFSISTDINLNGDRITSVSQARAYIDAYERVALASVEIKAGSEYCRKEVNKSSLETLFDFLAGPTMDAVADKLGVRIAKGTVEVSDIFDAISEGSNSPELQYYASESKRIIEEMNALSQYDVDDYVAPSIKPQYADVTVDFIGKEIQIKSMITGKWVSCNTDQDVKGINMTADRENPSGWESFHVIAGAGNTIGLRAYNGNFVSARMDESSQPFIQAAFGHDYSEPGEWERFKIFKLKDTDYYCIRSEAARLWVYSESLEDGASLRAAGRDTTQYEYFQIRVVTQDITKKDEPAVTETPVVTNPGKKTVDEFIDYIKSLVGKGVDYDGVYGAQCVDLTKYAYVFLGERAVLGNGCDYATNALPDGWTRVYGGEPQRGDILVYSATVGNAAGHVAIYDGAGHFDQNYYGNMTVQYYTDNFRTPNYWGYIRPAFKSVTEGRNATEKVSCHYQGTEYNEGWYEGLMTDGKPNGFGKLTYDGFDDGSYYALIYSDGRKVKALYYEGYFVNGWRNGPGKMVYEDGTVDDGIYYGQYAAGKTVFDGKRSNENGYYTLKTVADSAVNGHDICGEWISTQNASAVNNVVDTNGKIDYGNWSEWSREKPQITADREIETRETIIGYHMETFLTQNAQYPYARVYRDYSLNGNYEGYGARRSYGELHYEYYASKDAIQGAATAKKGDFICYASNTQGYAMGNGTAYVGWNVQDCLIWYIKSVDSVTEYRYRNVIKRPVTVTPTESPKLAETSITTPIPTATPTSTPRPTVTPVSSTTPVVTPKVTTTPVVTPKVTTTPVITPKVTTTPVTTPIVSFMVEDKVNPVENISSLEVISLPELPNSFSAIQENAPQFLYEEEDEYSEADIIEEIETSKPSLKKLTIRNTVSGKAAIRLKWTIDCNCDVDYYEVYRSTKKNGSFGNPIHITKSGSISAYKNSKIKKGITYYYKIRGVKVVGDKLVYTKFSNVRSKKIPKK